MTPTRYTLELHPHARDGSPNSWLAKGYQDDKLIVMQCGDTADKALRKAMSVPHA